MDLVEEEFINNQFYDSKVDINRIDFEESLMEISEVNSNIESMILNNK